MFMEARDKVKSGHEAFMMGAFVRRWKLVCLRNAFANLREIVLGKCFGVSWKALAGEPPAHVKPMRVTLSRMQVSRRSRPGREYTPTPDKSAWPKEYFELIGDGKGISKSTGGVCGCGKDFFPEGPGKWYHLVADSPPILG